MNLPKPDILTTIRGEGFEPKRIGRSLWLSCPFHTEKKPSLKINPDKQRFYCFGCGASGDSISFVQKLHGLSFKEALQHCNIQTLKPRQPMQTKKAQLVDEFREWERSMKILLTDFYREFHCMTRHLKTWEEVEAYEEDFHMIPNVEWLLEILVNGTDDDKLNLFKRTR